MEEKQLTLKIPHELHTKFKLYAVTKGKSMTEIIMEFIEKVVQKAEK